MHSPNSGRFAAAVRVIVTAAGDVLIAWMALFAIVTLRRQVDIPLTQALLPHGKFPLDATNVLVFAGAAVVALALSGHYDFRLSARHRPTLFVALPLQMALIAVVGTLLTRSWPRTVFVAVPFLEAAGFLAWRRAGARWWRQRLRTTVLVGDAASLSRFLADPPQWLRIGGVVSTGPPVADPRYVGAFDEPRSREAIANAEEVLDVGGGDAPGRRLSLLSLRGPAGYLFTPSVSDSLINAAPIAAVGDSVIARVSMPGAYGVGAAVKRTIDVAGAVLLFVLAAPVMAVTAALLFLDRGGPVLLRQKRVGRHGRLFGMWKFRTMRTGVPERLSVDEDQRVTAIGKWLRRYRLDELPQIFNVVSGDMSLVGPRPEMPDHTQRISETLPHFELRLLARPGLAGLAQTSAEYDQSPAVKLTYDLQYLCSWNVVSDLSILVRAVVTVLSGRGV